MFTSERHLKVLQDKENAVLIGTAMDELIRDHPALKERVFKALRATLGKIEDLGAMWEVPVDVREWYELVPISSEESECEDEDVVMDGADVDGATETLASGVPVHGRGGTSPYLFNPGSAVPPSVQHHIEFTLPHTFPLDFIYISISL